MNLTPQEKKFLLDLMNAAQIRGFEASQMLLSIAQKIQTSLQEPTPLTVVDGPDGRYSNAKE
jgi:hypothetical protein